MRSVGIGSSCRRLLWGTAIFNLFSKSLESRPSSIEVLGILGILQVRNELSLVVKEGIPVDIRKPRVASNLRTSIGILFIDVRSKSLTGVDRHELVHKID